MKKCGFTDIISLTEGIFMGIEFYIAQGISVINGVLAVIMMQFKNMRHILIFQIICNLLTASSYFLLGGLSGAGICIIAIVQSVVMFIYNIKKVAPHKVVIAAFVLLYIGCSVFYYRSFIDIFSAIAAVCFALSVVQAKASMSRLWYQFNPICWIIYDIYTMAYGNLALHIVVGLSTFIGILRNDIKKKSE